MSILNVFKKFPSSFKPSFERPRYKCPFYGFSVSLADRLLFEMETQCALSTAGCQMECRGDEINWGKCPYNNRKNDKMINIIINSFGILPAEFRHLAIQGGAAKGMPFRQWMGYILDDKIKDLTKKDHRKT